MGKGAQESRPNIIIRAEVEDVRKGVTTMGNQQNQP